MRARSSMVERQPFKLGVESSNLSGLTMLFILICQSVLDVPLIFTYIRFNKMIAL